MLLGSKKKATRAHFERMLRMGVPREVVVVQAAAAGITMEDGLDANDKIFLKDTIVASGDNAYEKHHGRCFERIVACSDTDNIYGRYFNSMIHNMIAVPYQWPTNDNRIVILEKRKLASSKILGALALATRPILLKRVSQPSRACNSVYRCF